MRNLFKVVILPEVNAQCLIAFKQTPIPKDILAIAKNIGIDTGEGIGISIDIKIDMDSRVAEYEIPSCCEKCTLERIAEISNDMSFLMELYNKANDQIFKELGL